MGSRLYSDWDRNLAVHNLEDLFLEERRRRKMHSFVIVEVGVYGLEEYVDHRNKKGDGRNLEGTRIVVVVVVGEE